MLMPAHVPSLGLGKGIYSQWHSSKYFGVRVSVSCFLKYTRLYKLLTHGFGA